MKWLFPVLLVLTGLLRELSLAWRFGVASESDIVFKYLPLAAVLSECAVVITVHNKIVPNFLVKISL